MLTIGLVVEGIYDEAALKELIQKCARTQVEVIGRPCHGVNRLMQKFPNVLKEFQYVKGGSRVDKALVIRDAGNKDAQELKTGMQAMISNRRYSFPVKLLVVVKELEAWLLADEDAVKAVTGKKATSVQNPENVSNPKERLQSILSEARISYTAEIARKIAANTRVEALESRCPSFKQFQEAILDC